MGLSEVKAAILLKIESSQGGAGLQRKALMIKITKNQICPPYTPHMRLFSSTKIALNICSKPMPQARICPPIDCPQLQSGCGINKMALLFNSLDLVFNFRGTYQIRSEFLNPPLIFRDFECPHQETKRYLDGLGNKVDDSCSPKLKSFFPHCFESFEKH